MLVLADRRLGKPRSDLDLITGDGDYIAFTELLRFLLRHRLAVYNCAVAAQVLDADFAMARKKSKVLTRNLGTSEINRTDDSTPKNQPFSQIARNCVRVRIVLFSNDQVYSHLYYSP